MPRQKYKLAHDEGRDIDGIVHKAIPNTARNIINPLMRGTAGYVFYYNAACDGREVGKNNDRLWQFCEVCFPGRNKPKIASYNTNLPSLDLDGREDVGNIEGAKQILRDQYHVEEIDISSWELPKIPRKPKSNKTLDEILRRSSRSFTRRQFRA